MYTLSCLLGTNLHSAKGMLYWDLKIYHYSRIVGLVCHRFAEPILVKAIHCNSTIHILTVLLFLLSFVTYALLEVATYIFF